MLLFNFSLPFQHFPTNKLTVNLSFLCGASLADGLSHQWQAFHAIIMGDNEQKSVWEAEVVIWVKKREYVRRKPEVSETDWLSPLSVGYCASVSACSPQRLPPFFILLQHFSFFAFFLPPSSPPSTAVSFSMSCFVSLFARDTCALLIFITFQTLFSARRLFFCYAYWHIALNDDFQRGPAHGGCGWLEPCVRPSRDRQ